MTKSLIERINEKCVIDETRIYNGTPCKIWQGSKRQGYGIVTNKGKQLKVHRAVYEHEFGKIPEDKIIRHMCHNKDCCEITHLQIGTQKENAMDEVMAGKSARGEKNPSAKLKQKDIIPIRNDTRPTKVIAEQYGVCVRTINEIKTRKKWGWVEDDKTEKYVKPKIKVRLKEKDIISIRKDNRKVTVIAKEYNVNPSTISRIKRNLLWSQIKNKPTEKVIKCSTKFRKKEKKSRTLEDFTVKKYEEEALLWISLLERG